MPLPTLQNLNFETLAKAMNFGSLSYAVSALTRRHRVDYAGNYAYGLCDSKSTLGNIARYLRRAYTKDSQQKYHEQTQDFSDKDYLTPKDVQLPVYTAFSSKDIWSYDADPALLENYRIHKLWGLVGNSKQKHSALLSLVSIPKEPTAV